MGFDENIAWANQQFQKIQSGRPLVSDFMPTIPLLKKSNEGAIGESRQVLNLVFEAV